MNTVLVSFLGTGRIKKDEVDAYQKTTYVFPDGEEYSTPLATAPLVSKASPDKVIFIGTSKSMWPAMDELAKYAKVDIDQKLHSQVFEETLSESGVSQEVLSKWEEYLNAKLPYQLSLKLVKDEYDMQSIVKHMYDEIPRGVNDVILEITHAFRHFPLIASFTLPILRITHNIGKVSFVYGLFGGGKSTIMFLNEVNKLIELLESLALSEYGGNFSKFADIFDSPILKELYLKVETNRRISASYLKKVYSGLDSDDVYKAIASEYIRHKILSSLQGEYLSLRLANRAVFFAEKGQYLKAFTLIYEAIVSCFLNRQEYDRANTSGRKHEIYEKAKARADRELKSMNKEWFQVWKEIRKVRNAIAHGDELKNEQVDEEYLKILAYKGRELVEALLKHLRGI